MSAPSFDVVAPDKLEAVTGTPGATGLAAAEAFANAGMRLVLAGRADEAL